MMLRFCFYIVFFVIVFAPQVEAQGEEHAVEEKAQTMRLEDALKLTVPVEEKSAVKDGEGEPKIDEEQQPEVKEPDEVELKQEEPDVDEADNDVGAKIDDETKQETESVSVEEGTQEELEQPSEELLDVPPKNAVSSSKTEEKVEPKLDTPREPETKESVVHEPKAVSKPAAPKKADPINVKPLRKPSVPVGHKKSSVAKAPAENKADTSVNRAANNAPQVSRSVTQVTQAQALSLAIDSAPPAEDFEIFREMQGDRAIYQILFKTEKGPYEVQVDVLNGEILYSDYRDDLGGYPSKAGHLPKKWFQE